MDLPTYSDFRLRVFPDDENVFYLHGKNGYLYCEEIDQLAAYPKMDTIRIYGLKQDTFEYFIIHYGKQFRRIHFFKDQLVEDWSLLSKLTDLECLYWYWNQRITSIWDISQNTSLTALHISDFTRLHNLDGIAKAPALRMLFVGDSIFPSMTLQSLLPLAGMKIEYLSWQGKKLLNPDLSFFLTLKNLKQFDCPLNFFTTEQCAWITANCPQADGRIFHPYEDWSTDNEQKIAIVGKRKPILDVCRNEDRIRKYIDTFERLVNSYKGIPYRKAFPDSFD